MTSNVSHLGRDHIGSINTNNHRPILGRGVQSSYIRVRRPIVLYWGVAANRPAANHPASSRLAANRRWPVDGGQSYPTLGYAR